MTWPFRLEHALVLVTFVSLVVMWRPSSQQEEHHLR